MPQPAPTPVVPTRTGRGTVELLCDVGVGGAQLAVGGVVLLFSLAELFGPGTRGRLVVWSGEFAARCVMGGWNRLAHGRRPPSVPSAVGPAHCLGCGRALTDPAGKCPACGTVPFRRLDANRLWAHRPPAISPDLFAAPGPFAGGGVVVHATAHKAEASLLAGQLKARGLRADVAAVHPSGRPTLLVYRVRVDPADAADATAIVGEFAARP